MLLPLQGVNTMAIRNPGCRFACPGLGAFGLSARPRLNPKLEFMSNAKVFCFLMKGHFLGSERSIKK